MSPKVERKMVYAGANSQSFEQASRDLKVLAELEIKGERVRRATRRNGAARCELTRRLNYPEYRRKGYPLTSSIMESAVKQINRHVKGSEKFWSTSGGTKVIKTSSRRLDFSSRLLSRNQSLYSGSEAKDFRVASEDSHSD